MKKLVLAFIAFIAIGCTVAQADFCKPGTNSGTYGMTFCAVGNTARAYDARGRLVAYGVRHGSVMRNYDARGRRIGTVYYNGSNTDWRNYNMRGCLIGTRASYTAAGGR
jgi:YD repeat-containing protein